jgi:hypothetical protein
MDYALHKWKKEATSANKLTQRSPVTDIARFLVAVTNTRKAIHISSQPTTVSKIWKFVTMVH